MNEFQNHYSRGMVLYEQSRYEQAEKEFGLAIATDPQNSSAHAMLGMALYHQGYLLKAKKEAEEAIRLAPDAAFSHYALSIILRLGFTFDKSNREDLPLEIQRLTQNGSSMHATRAAEEAVRLEPENPGFLSNLAYLRVWSRKWDDALAIAERGLARDPNDTGCLHVRVLALTGLRRQEEAAAAIERFIAQHPEHPFAHKLLGQHKMIAKPTEAEEHLLASLRLDPLSESAQRALGQARNLEFIRARNPAAASPVKAATENQPAQPSGDPTPAITPAGNAPASPKPAAPAGLPDPALALPAKARGLAAFLAKFQRR
jgi:tetratricopeptide (TPR) repeat protein